MGWEVYRPLLGGPWVWGRRQIHLMESPTFWATLTCWPSAFPVWGSMTWFNIFSLLALSFCNSQNGCSLSLIHGAACDLGGFQNHSVGGPWACGRVCELCGQGFHKSQTVSGGPEGTKGTEETDSSLPKPLLMTSSYSSLHKTLGRGEG